MSFRFKQFEYLTYIPGSSQCYYECSCLYVRFELKHLLQPKNITTVYTISVVKNSNNIYVTSTSVMYLFSENYIFLHLYEQFFFYPFNKWIKFYTFPYNFRRNKLLFNLVDFTFYIIFTVGF